VWARAQSVNSKVTSACRAVPEKLVVAKLVGKIP
jgi:hypothetical protein